ncbi:hypothetical protein [Aquimarina sp. I32.4]|nr:hypothetical protein [Aquimarina sp. I32.4]
MSKTALGHHKLPLGKGKTALRVLYKLRGLSFTQLGTPQTTAGDE